jgi:IMP dehydrogenase
MCEYIAKNHPEVLLVAGNVATGEGAARLVDVGADVIKCGIGGGSSCSTRVEAAAGVPQLTALWDVVDRLDWNSNNVSIIADGGIRFAGDAVKALCLADMVMVGGMFAGCDEAPGEMINIDGIQYKEYRGSSTHKQNRIEGVVHLAPYKGSASNILQKITEGIQSGCSYQGVDNLKDLKEEPFFVKISQAGLIESHPHTFNKK